MIEDKMLAQPSKEITTAFFCLFDCMQMFSAMQRTSFIEEAQFSIARFANQELHATVPAEIIASRHCLVFGSIAPPDERLLSLLLLADTLKRGGASQISAICPYLSYTRQDKVKAGESLGMAWIGSLLAASGVGRIMTVDVHSERDKQLIPIPLISLSPAKLFAAEIKKRDLVDATIIAADEGAIARCEAVRNAAGMSANNMAYFKKRRAGEGIYHGDLNGQVGRRAIFVDDILDTGGTLLSACRKLVEAKVEEIYIFVTHGLFTGSAWGELWALGVRHIFCTDTIQSLDRRPGLENITVLSVAPLIQEHLNTREWQ